MRRTIPQILVLALLLVSSASQAQPPNDPADVAFRQGTELFRQGKYEAARSTLAQAFARKQTFDIAVALGFAEVKLEHWPSAARSLAWALRHWAPTGKAASRESAEHWLDEAKMRVGTIEVRPSAAGARVTVDGEPVAEEDLAHEVFVDPGPHTIVARREGYKDAQRSIMASAGSKQSVALTLVSERTIVPGVVLGSVAGAALVTGIGLFVAGHVKVAGVFDERDAILKAGHACVTGALNYDTRCPDVQSTATAANTFQKAGVGLMVGAGVAAVGSVLYFVLPTSSAGTKTGGLRVTPAVSPGNAGLVFAGSF